MSSSHHTTQQQGKGNLRPTKSSCLAFDDKPLWNHVTVLRLAPDGGGNRFWTCNYCSKGVTGSYSKVKGHLLKLGTRGVGACTAISDDVFEAIKREHGGAEKKKTEVASNEKRKAEYVTLPEGSDLIQNKKFKGALEKSFNIGDRDVADKECARMFYASALSFNVSRSPYFRQYSQTLANSRITGYTPPTYDRLRTTLLAQEKEHVNRLLQPIRDTWKQKGVSLVSDGWSDRQRRPLINIMAASAGSAIFIKAIDSTGKIKDTEYVASLFSEAIEEIGVANVVQILTDSASNCKAAGLLIEKKYPKIFWTPCVVHSLNLALKSICAAKEKSAQYDQCKWISDLVNDVQDIRNFVVNHGMALSLFKNYSGLSLLRVADTRFASSIIQAKRLREVKLALEQMVMDSEWKTYRGEGNSQAETKARQVKQTIVDDTWWDKLDYLLSFTEPIINMLRRADIDSPVLHLVYDMWDTMIEDVKKIIFEHEGLYTVVGHSNFFDVIQTILVSRWNKSNTPLHCLAHSLVPKYYSNAWLQDGNTEVQRLSPHQDQEVSTNRSLCFTRLFENPIDLHKVFVEYGAFSSGSAYFDLPHVVHARMVEEPVSWWANHGASTPLLQTLAFKLLVQPASSSCCERNWSTYALIQSIKRNRLTPSRADDLVFVHSNLRLLSRKNEKEYKEGPTKFWDISEGQFDVDGVDQMEYAGLSLDEPSLEGVIFGNEDEDGDEMMGTISAPGTRLG